MELLLRLVTPRRVFVALLAVGSAKLAWPYVPKAYCAFMAWRYPPVAADAGTSAAGNDIAAEQARRLAVHVQVLAKTADDGLAAARARGDDVSRLDAKRREAAAASASDPKRAADLLNQIIAETPAAPTGVLPLGKQEADEEEIEPDVQGRKTNQFVESGLAPARRRRKAHR